MEDRSQKVTMVLSSKIRIFKYMLQTNKSFKFRRPQCTHKCTTFDKQSTYFSSYSFHNFHTVHSSVQDFFPISHTIERQNEKSTHVRDNKFIFVSTIKYAYLLFINENSTITNQKNLEVIIQFSRKFSHHKIKQ